MKRTAQEIEDQIVEAIDQGLNGSKYPGMTYEDGVKNALEWVSAQTNVKPMDDEECKIKYYGIKCHADTNHTYDGKPYSVHLEMVQEYAVKYLDLLKKDQMRTAVDSTWVHDVIEDCRQTYNDVKAVCGEEIAEVAYALTNEKGRNRKERANDTYYEGIRNNPVAHFVKICDRLANMKHSKESGSRMLEMYRKEHKEFVRQLWSAEFAVMFDEMRDMVK